MKTQIYYGDSTKSYGVGLDPSSSEFEYLKYDDENAVKRLNALLASRVKIFEGMTIPEGISFSNTNLYELVLERYTTVEQHLHMTAAVTEWDKLELLEECINSSENDGKENITFFRVLLDKFKSMPDSTSRLYFSPTYRFFLDKSEGDRVQPKGGKSLWSKDSEDKSAMCLDEQDTERVHSILADSTSRLRDLINNSSIKIRLKHIDSEVEDSKPEYVSECDCTEDTYLIVTLDFPISHATSILFSEPKQIKVFEYITDFDEGVHIYSTFMPEVFSLDNTICYEDRGVNEEFINAYLDFFKSLSSGNTDEDDSILSQFLKELHNCYKQIHMYLSVRKYNKHKF